MRKTGLFIVIVYVGFILLLHLIPTGFLVNGNGIWGVGHHVDYMVHILLFLPWMMTGMLLVQYKVFEKGSLFLPSWMFVGIFLAIGAETLQIATAFRMFNPVDMMLNIAGVVIGWLPARLFISKR